MIIAREPAATGLSYKWNDYVSVDGVTIAELRPCEWTEVHVSVNELHTVSVHWLWAEMHYLANSFYSSTLRWRLLEESILLNPHTVGDVYIWFGFTNEHVEGGPGAVPGDKRVAHVHRVTTWPEFIELDSQRYVTAGVEPQAGLWTYRCPDPR